MYELCNKTYACILLEECLSLILLHEYFKSICSMRLRQFDLKKYAIKVAVTGALFIVGNGAIVLTRCLVTDKGAAYTTFLNVDSVPLAARCVITGLTISITVKMVLGFNGNEFKEQETVVSSMRHYPACIFLMHFLFHYFFHFIHFLFINLFICTHTHFR